MAFKRNKKAKMTTEAPVEEAPIEETPVEEVEEVVNADEMAEAVSTSSGNDYQQYIRNLFKNKLK